MICSACAHENRPSAKFCEECASPLARVCASCGAQLRPTAKFCDECATPVAAGGAGSARAGSAGPRAPAAATPSAGTRKIVTIVFADLAGSTAMQERLDPESVRRFMERYYDAMRDAVESHGGSVTQFLGDGVKAVFGIPRVAEDDAIRAVRAGAAMQRSFRTLAESQVGAVGTVGLRVAVNTGEVVANDDDEIIGDPVNVAARLQEQGGDGDVVVGGSTARLVAALVTLEPLGSFALKGRAEAVDAFRLESLERPAGAATAAFVGREEELAAVTSVYETAIDKPATALAVLLGSPGLGKSRLIGEFIDRLGDAVCVVEAQCDEASLATFAPLADALRERLGIDQGASADSVRAAIESAIPADKPQEQTERARIATGIAALLAGSPASPEETFFVVRRFFAALASAQPVVLVVDDLQWAEPLLLDLVEHLVQWGSGVPLLVLVGARPELRDVRSSLVTPGGLVSEVVTLGGLDAGAAMRLAANVIGASDLPAVVAAKVLAASEGNPLFVGELVRMLVFEGALKREGDRWTTGTALEALEMPPTIHALLAARIARLRPDERVVLERAAVVGCHFSRSAVAELLPAGVADLDARLESLRRGELIQRDTGWFLGEPVLRFHHVLIRDAAYRQLLKGTRAELHERFANWVEACAGDATEHDEIIGWHLEQAHQHLSELGPISAAGRVLGERASARLAAEGRRALARDDLSVASSLLGRAIARLDPEDLARADLALDWCEALLAAGDVGPAAGAIDELDRFVGDSARLRAWHTCFAGEHTVLTAPEGLPKTADAVAAAADVMAAQGDAAGEAKAHFVHALVFRRLGKIGACEAALDRALAAARRVAGDRRRANSVLAIAPLAALWGPSPVTRASGRCLDVVRVLRITQGAPAVEAVALSCQGVLEALRGRTDAAHRMIASARKMVEELGITQRLLEADVFGAQVELLEGDAPAAERSLLAAYHGLRELGLGIDAARAAALLARALLAQDRVAEAEALSHESEVLAGDDLKAAIAWRGVRAEALARRGEHAAAVEFANRAVELASATDALLDHADARLALAAALRAAGRGREADAEERRAHELWEAKGATLLAERARGDGARAVIAPAAEKSGAEDLTARRRVRANSATAALARILAAFDARDSVALRATYHENSLCIDHPTGSTYGVDEGVAGMVALFRSDGAYYRGEPLATLGESLLLFRRWSGARSTGAGRYDVGEYEAERFHVVEADASGCMVRMEIFAADHLNDAIDCLYARYAQQLPEGPVRTRIAKVAECMAIMLSAPNELERLARLLAPDLECIDHRHLSLWSGRGAELFLEQRRAVHQVAEDVSFTTQEILALEPDAMLSRVMHSGTEREGGGAYERPFLAIVVFDAEGRMGRLEWFDDDREADALARFDRLSAAPTSAPATRSRTHPNLGTAMNDRFMRAFSTGDFDAFRSAIHPNCRVTDHPTGSSYGVDGAIASMQRLFRSRDPFYQIETLATLGRTLVLSRRRLGSSGDIRGSYDVGAYESEALDVSEVDEDGRTTAIDIFAADQLSDAISCLYARRAEQLPTGAARERAQATARSVATTLGRFDERRYTDAFRSDCEIVDHRLLGFGREAGPDRLIRSIAQASVVGTQVVGHSLDALALSESGLLVRWRTSGLGRESGGEFEWVFLRLFGFDSDGRIAHYELFDDDREAEALARFERLTAGASRTPAAANRLRENAAIAAAKRMAAALRSRDFSALEAVLGEAMTAIDHRWHASYGRDGVVETCRRFMQPNDVSFRTDPIATLGEDLSISRQFITAGGSTAGRFDVGEHETEYLSLSEVDRSGVFQRMEFFAADRLGVAVARLYERHAERLPEGSERDRAAATASSVAVWIGPIDADRIATAVAPNVESIDHRTLASWSARGADEFLGYWRLQGDITEGAALRIDAVLAVADNAILDRRIYHGTGRDTGGAFENWVLGLWVFGADGLLTRVEVWEPDAEAAALARFDAVVDRADAREDPFANAASRANRRRTDCFNARDWAGIEACIAPDFAFDERRRLLRNTADRETWLAQTRLLFDVPDSRFAIELLATRGERLSLHLHRFAGTVAGGGGPLAVDDHLALHEVDEGGRIVATLLFDLEDESAAYAELDARFERGEAAAYPRAVKMIVARTHLDATRDWQAYAATLAPGFAYRDHRLLGWGSEGHDAQTLIRMQQSAVEVAPDARYRQDHVRVAQRGVLRRTTLVGTREGGAFENPMLTVHEADDQGRSVRVDSYDIDDLDRALARFAELSAPAPAQSRHSQSPFANTATRALARSAAAWEAQDWDRFGANLPAHFRASDRRRAVQLELDRDQWIAFVRSVGDMQSTRMRVELLATRGDRLALTQIWIELAGDDLGDSEISHLSLIEVDGHGTPIATVRWDEEDLAAAYAELDARFFAGEGTAEPHVLRAIRATGEAWRKRDWDALAACCAPGFVYSDHRVLGFGEILDDPQKWAHSQRVLVELAPDADTRVDHIRFSSRGALRQLTQLGTRDGGAFATSFLSVLSVDPRGRVERMDVYDLDRYDEARAHFDALTTDAPSSSAFANAATRFNERFLRYWDARDWDAIRAMHRPTCEVDDRRQLMKLESPAEDTFRFFFDQPNSRWTVTPIATRGERLALSRIELECDVDEEGGAASIDYLVIDDVDLDGFSTAMVTFDPDDLDAAFTELDARWLASLGTGPEMPFLRDFSAALARRDWDGVASCYASEFVGEDHRLVSWGTLRGPFGFVRALQEMVALAPDAVMRMNHVRVSSRGSLHDATWSGTRDGGAFESPFVSVNEFDAVGKVVRNEFYDPKHIDRALARFDALTTTAASTAHPFANRATRAFDQQIRYFSERNWSGFADLLPTGFRYLDRRRVAQLELNADEFIEFIRPLGEMASTRLFAEVLATRGDRLALVAMHFEGAGGDIGPSAIDDISVVEADARGHIVERVRFDAEDLDAAYAELEARWRAGEAAEYPIALTSLRNFGIALARRDWEAIAACFAAGFVGEDHRLVGWGRLHGPARFADTMREMIALAPDAEVQTHHLRVSTRAILFEAAWVGSRDGGAFESPLVLVVELDALALARRVDVFDLHHLDRALARFGELANAVPPRVLSDLARPNAASEWLIRFQPAFNARDWDRIRDLYAPGVRYEDRQRFSRVSGGLDMLKSSIRERAETGALLERVELVGTAGDRVAAQRVLWAGLGSGDRFEMEFLVVQQVDETGRLVVTVNFDADDTRAAQREMWARWAAIEPHVAAFTTPFGAWIDAFNAGDRDGWRAQFADDLVVDDHRRTGFGRLDGADAYADSLAVLQELAPETQIEAGWHWLAYDRHRAIASVRRTGVIPDGGEFESEYLNLFTVSDGKITQIELFEVDAADAALARFEQLRADPLRVPTNAATRALEPMARLIADRDLEALRALTTDDFCFDDRSKRAQLRGGVEEWLRALQFLRSEIRGQNESHLLAAPGDRLALARVVWRESSGDSPFLIENYRLTEVDASGRLRALVLFDPDDRAAAHDELFERWVATGGVPEGWSEMIRGMNAHDLERVRAALPVDVVIDDHRRTGYGRLEGIDAFLESLAAVFELSPDARWDTRYRIADGPHGFLDLNCMWGTNAEGGDFESPFIALQLYRGGRLHDGEMFEVDHFDEALARFEALRPDPHAEPSTAATRVRDRIAAAFPRRDWDALRALVAADFVYDDRGKRALVCGDVDTWIDSMKFNAQPGFHAGSTPIGAIGDRLALDHVVWFGKPGGDAFEIERIRVLDVDAEGKLRAAIFFDPDDRAAAFAQAQACFLAGEGAVVGGQEPTARVFSAFDAGDWAGLRAVMAPDASFHDHRRLGLGALDVDVWIDSLRALGELTTDLKFEEIRTLACNRHGRVMMGRTRGTNPEGGPFENVFVLVHRSRGDQLLNHEVFDPEDAARALARFEQLCAERGEPDS